MPACDKRTNPTAARPTIAVYYFPQWHVDPRNTAHYGHEWTEWKSVQMARPRFPGHEQPKVPVWGYEMEDVPKAMAKKIDAGADHSVDALVFDWYFNANGPHLNGALERGFLGVANSARLKFAAMRATHSPCCDLPSA